MNSNRITQEQVNEMVKKTKLVFEVFGQKTLVMVATLPNGFVIVDGSSCVDPENFDFNIGRNILLKRLENKIWELEGYVLQKVQAN